VFNLLARIVITTLVAALLSGCSLPKLSLPKLYKITVQQGNVITQEMVDQLKPGMTRSQVAFIMGEPILRNTFNEDRWDYIYSVVLPGYFETQVRMSLFFANEALAYFTGDLAPTEVPEEEATPEEDLSAAEAAPEEGLPEEDLPEVDELAVDTEAELATES
jgi:outer membrane protein assembly factor BamE